MTQKILVTGGAGFIGSNFCNTHKERYEIVALDNLFLGDTRNLDPEIRFVEGDACKLEDLQKCGEKFDAVLHLAGTSSAPMFNGDGFVWGYRNAIESFCQALEFARSCGAKKFLYASTSSLYGNNPTPLTEDQRVTPPNHYAVTKKLYEDAARCYTRVYPELETIGFRFMSVYGPNEEAKGAYANIISQFLWDMARGREPIIYGDGTQDRDFTNVADIVEGITLALETDRPLGSTVYNIGTGKATTFNAIIKALQSALGSDLSPRYIPNPVKESYVASQLADITKISTELGYTPRVTLEHGIKNLVQAIRLDRIRQTSSDALR